MANDESVGCEMMMMMMMMMMIISTGATAPRGPGPHYRGFTITLRHTTFGRTPLGE
jgi:hypothetical protein